MINTDEFFKVFLNTGLPKADYSRAVYGNFKTFEVNLAQPPKYGYFNSKNCQKILNAFPGELKKVIGKDRLHLVQEGSGLEYRHVDELRAIKGLTYLEMAEDLNMSKGNFKVTLSNLKRESIIPDNFVLRLCNAFPAEMKRLLLKRPYIAINLTLKIFHGSGVDFDLNYRQRDYEKTSILESYPDF